MKRIDFSRIKLEVEPGRFEVLDQRRAFGNAIYVPSLAPVTRLSHRERHEARRRLMVARFYYWTELRRRRFDDVMQILSESEFFVDERTVTNVLRALSRYLSKLCARGETAADLRRAYPSWNWEVTPAKNRRF